MSVYSGSNIVIAKLNYATGIPVFMSFAQGTFIHQPFMHRAFAQDPISKKILLSLRRADISGIQTHYLCKIDVTVDPPV